jgi:hypothetical protein
LSFEILDQKKKKRKEKRIKNNVNKQKRAKLLNKKKFKAI